MDSAPLDCPLCCEEQFCSTEMLRDHLSTYIWEHLLCPVCGHNFIGVQGLWFHLEEHIQRGKSPSVLNDKLLDCVGAEDAAIIIKECISQDSNSVSVQDISDDSHIARLEVDKHVRVPSNLEVLENDGENSFGDEEVESNSNEERSADKHCHDNESSQFLCGICELQLSSFDEVKIHAEQSHGINFIMVSESSSVEEMERILSNSMLAAETSSVANLCELRSDKQYASNQEHSQHNHNSSPKTVRDQKTLNSECEICGKCFSSPKLLSIHRERLHLKVKSCLCQQCGMSFYDSYGLKAHMKLHKSDKPFSCEICKKQFVWAADLRRHEGVHTGKMTHICEVCGKGYLNGYQLNVHLRSHTGDRPFVCTVCGAAFMSKSNLRSHGLTHISNMNDNFYACRFCAKTFPSRSKLYHHHRMHLKPFKCEKCGHGFTCSRDVEQHMRTHSKDYKCRFCGVQFTQAAKLVKHESSHGKEDSINLR